MNFGEFKLDQAHGGILAHRVETPDGILRKGALVDDRAQLLLQSAGYRKITIARLEPGDVTEDDAASILGNLLLTPGLRRSSAVNGRVEVFAARDGLCRTKIEKVTRLNLIDESIALSTLADYSPVNKGDLVASLKIIPFGVSGALLSRVERVLSKENAMLDVKPFHHLKVGLLVTTSPYIKPATIAKTIHVTQMRIMSRGGSVLPHLEVPHDTGRIAIGIRQLVHEGADMILISGASAVADRRDVAPQAILQAGGKISHFGMPVDPGNLLCFGSVGEVPAIVLPGCARSLALNGIDWVLDRLFAGESFGASEIAAMGAGGLLKQTGSRAASRYMDRDGGTLNYPLKTSWPD